METIRMMQKAAAVGQVHIGSFITTHLLVHHVLCRLFW